MWDSTDTVLSVYDSYHRLVSSRQFVRYCLLIHWLNSLNPDEWVRDIGQSKSFHTWTYDWYIVKVAEDFKDDQLIMKSVYTYAFTQRLDGRSCIGTIQRLFYGL